MDSSTSKNCRANYWFSLNHFTLLLFDLSVGSTEQKCLSVATTLSRTDDLSTSLDYCSYCSYFSPGKGAMKPPDAFRAAEYDSRFECSWLWGWSSKQRRINSLLHNWPVIHQGAKGTSGFCFPT